MKTLRVYLDTSVIGGCFDKEFEEASNKLIEEIKSGLKIGVISQITIEEIEKSPKHVRDLLDSLKDYLEFLEPSIEVENLTDEYLKANIVTQKYFYDAAHIAYATVYNIDLLVSWNFKHIVNYNKIIQFNSVNMKNSYKNLQIHIPQEVINNE